MSYAQKTKQNSIQSLRVSAYGLSVGALWGDVNDYNPANDGEYTTFFQSSAEKRKKWLKASCEENIRTPQQILEDQQRISEKAQQREKRQEQARAALAIKQVSPYAHLKACKCGCGRLEHPNPRPDVVGLCCGWCSKHRGKRGHGEACLAICSTTYQKIA